MQTIGPKHTDEPLASYDYRVVSNNNGNLAIAEVYYDTEGQPTAYDLDCFPLTGTTITDLEEDLRNLRAALARPIIPLQDLQTLDESLTNYFN